MNFAAVTVTGLLFLPTGVAVSRQSSAALELKPGPRVPLAIAHIRCCDPRTRIVTLPYTISTPGSYVVVRDLNVSAATDGISVSASDVTIDLLGFTLDGGGLGLDGIAISGGVKNVTVTNGVVRRWTGDGIDAFTLEGGRFEGLHVASNANLPGSAGITLGLSCIVNHCTLVSNGENGVRVGQNCLVTNCTVGHTNGVGISFEGGARSTVRGCTILRSLGAGIRATGLSTIQDNELIENAGNGIELLLPEGGRARVEGNNLATNGGAGIFVDPAITIACIVRNFATGNSPDYSVPAVAGMGPVGSPSSVSSPWANLTY